MENIIDYALKFNKTFNEEQFNEVDSLILSQLCYLNLDDYSSEIGEGFTIEKLSQNIKPTLLKTRVPKQNEKLLIALSKNPRFKNISIINYENIRNRETEQQFSATMYKWDDIGFIAFRGTDSTVIGWKEDFNAMFKDIIPSQEEAVNYIHRHQDILPYLFFIGGHSKGGNLAVFASIFVKPDIQDRIIKVFDNDGPGVRKEVFDCSFYQKIKNRIVYILPEQSVFGAILFNNDDYLVVKSDGMWIQQHDPYRWHIENNCFVYLDNIKQNSQINREALNRWLYESSPEKRELMVDTIYKLMIISNAEKVGDIPVGLLKNYDTFIKTLKSLNKEDLNKIAEVIAELKGLKSEIEKATPSAEHRANNTDLQKMLGSVIKPIKMLINKLPIEEYLQIINNATIIKKTKGYATKIGKNIVSTTNMIVTKTNNATKEVANNVTRRLKQAKRQKTYTGKVAKENFVLKKVKPYKNKKTKMKQNTNSNNEKSVINTNSKKAEPTKKDIKKQKAIKETKKFKEKYFDYYDDIKHYSKGREDW